MKAEPHGSYLALRVSRSRRPSFAPPELRRGRLQSRARFARDWSGRRGSNPQRPAWKAGALPLSYARKNRTQESAFRSQSKKLSAVSFQFSDSDPTRPGWLARRSPPLTHARNGAKAGALPLSYARIYSTQESALRCQLPKHSAFSSQNQNRSAISTQPSALSGHDGNLPSALVFCYILLLDSRAGTQAAKGDRL